ncbi:MAG: oxygenase MpaB family protein, partial [Acidobacteria bacterium]|nr:oxygenase MpaB family protein [Acidobacteriota bacterium]
MSIARQVNREAVVVLGWGRAILMQLAHPLVTAGVGAHSDFDAGALAYARRMHGTISAMLSLTFGTEAEIRQAAKRINAIHRRVHGELARPVGSYEAGTRYDATDPALLAWVHATLVDSQLRTYALFVSPLGPDEEDRYCAEAAEVAPRLGVPPGLLPVTKSGLDLYLRQMQQADRLAVGNEARRLAAALLMLPGRPWSAPARWFGRLVTVGLLPPALREAYGFAWLERDHRRLRQAAAALRAARRIAPRVLREWPA